MELLNQIEFHWLWFGLATVLIILEALIGKRFLFLTVSFAASVIGILTYLYPYVGFAIQLLFFAVAAASLLWIVRSYLAERQAKIDKHQALVDSRHYVGQSITLISDIENGRSTQDVDGTLWILRGEDCAAGSQVKVVDMGQDWLAVEPLAEN